MIHNGKILVHKNVKSDHYTLIGGRVEIGENSADTVIREVKEELGKDIEIIGYISTIENFFEMARTRFAYFYCSYFKKLPIQFIFF